MLVRWLRREREVLAAILVQILALLPVLRTPYLFDDAFNSTFSGAMELQGKGLVGLTWEIAKPWLYEQGRFFPLAGLQSYGEFHFIHSLVGYKLVLIGWVVVSTVAVVALVRRLGASPALAALVAVGATLTMQMRYYHDPLYAYAGLQQAVLAYMALSALLFHVWLRGRSWWALAGSLLLIAVATLTYESAPLLCSIHLVVAIAERRSLPRGVLAALPPLGVGFAFLCMSLYLRSQASAPSAAYEAVLEPAKILPALGNQLLGTVPLSYVGLNPGDGFLYRGDLILGSMGAGSILVGAALAVVTWWLVRRAAAEEVRSPWTPWLALGLGAMLMLAPAAPISLAGRYQLELVAGLAYLPVYIQGFGLAMIAVGVLMLLRRRAPARAIAVAAILLGVFAGTVGAVTHRANTVLADNLQGDKETRRVLEAAVAGGLFEGAKRDARLIVGPTSPPWFTPSFIAQYGDQRFLEVVPAADPLAIDLKDPANADAWFWAPAPTHAIGGRVDGSGPTKVFLAGGTGTGRLLVADTEPPVTRVVADQDDDQMVTLPDGVPPQRVGVLPAPAEGVSSVPAFGGCGGLEGQGAEAFHWCGRTGAIAVPNSASRPRPMTVTFRVATGGTRLQRIVVTWPGGRKVVRAASTPRAVQVRLTVPAEDVAVIRLRTAAPRLRFPGDPRRLHMRVIAPVAVPG